MCSTGVKLLYQTRTQSSRHSSTQISADAKTFFAEGSLIVHYYFEFGTELPTSAFLKSRLFLGRQDAKTLWFLRRTSGQVGRCEEQWAVYS